MINNYDINSDDCAGGVVAILSCSRSVNVRRNHIYNAGISFRTASCLAEALNPISGTNMVMAGGLEIWGRNIAVEQNTVRYMPDEGIFAGSVADLRVQNNNIIENTSRSFVNPGQFHDDRAGIRIINKQVVCSGGVCSWVYRSTNGIRIDQGNVIRNAGTRFQPFAIQILRTDTPPNPEITPSVGETFENVFIQGNVMSPNRLGEFCKSAVTNISGPSVVPSVSPNCINF